LIKRVGVLCGGSGSSKFASAISKYSREKEALDLGFVGNVGDNFWYHGLLVCPDIDIITYALSDQLDTQKGWGILNDGYLAKQALSQTGGSAEWFTLGDRDLAICLRRTELLRKGWSLSSITRKLCNAMRARFPVIPSTDDPVQTFVKTHEGFIHLQEYWVKNEGDVEARGIEYVGVKKAIPTDQCLEYCDGRVLICPANPVTSVLPTLSLKGVVARLKRSKVIAVSPFVGDKPFSGPAAKLMKTLGLETNSFGVAKLYSDFLNIILVDAKEDSTIVLEIEDLGIECIKTDTRIASESDGKRIAMELMAAF
jgi:LPPG:FO 2-phospho-L-lactate transferase